jgi:hypothetical protein
VKIESQVEMKFKIGSLRKFGTVSFRNIFPEIIKEYQLEKLYTVENLALQWPGIVGEILSSHSLPDRIFKGILFIAVDHSMYANEIILMKDEILRKVGEESGSSFIRTIKTEVKRINWNR